jgi:hypothetical protein
MMASGPGSIGFRRIFGRRWLAGAVVALGTFLVLALVYSRHTYPPMPGTVRLQLTLPRGIEGQTDPILVTGMHWEGDLVVLRYLGVGSAEYSYDHWGEGGPRSARITFEPGTRHSLDITLPSLTTFQKPPVGTRGLVRLVFDGREILRADLPYHGRLPKQVYFGENAIGGSASPGFRGKLARVDGHVVRGGPESYFTSTERVFRWLRRQPWQAFGLALASIAVGGIFSWVQGLRYVQALRARVAALWPVVVRHRWFVLSAAGASLVYAWLVTLGTFNFNYAEVFGDFYDYQAASFLQGRLDVPEDAIGGEAFEANGKLYGYFGPTPAFLRLPFVILGLAFGKLSRSLMLLYFMAGMTAGYLLLRDAVKATLRHPAAEPSPFSILTLIASAGLGSTIFFLGSRGLIFHEAILAGITFALWSGWCALRHLQAPARRWWVAALIMGLLSLHCRPPTGLFALTLLGCVVVALAVRDWRQNAATTLAAVLGRRTARHLGVGALCFAALLTLNGLAYLKFGTTDPAPLRMSRPYHNNDRLAHIEGKSFHAANLPFNFYTYVLRPNFRIEPGFPWIYLGSPQPGHFFPKAKMDLLDHTLAMPFAMPSLFLLALLGGLIAFVALPGQRSPLAVIWLAAVPMTVALFAAIAIAQRYTGDFCPLLIVGAAWALAALESTAGPWRTLLRGATTLATLAGIAVTVAITIQYQGDYLWGVPEETQLNYLELRRDVDGFFGPARAPDR